MPMTRTQIVENSKAYLEWWRELGVDTAACFTVDPKRCRIRHHAQLVRLVENFMKQLGYRDHLDGVVEKGADGNWHAHAVLVGGRPDNERIRSAWYARHGQAMVRTAVHRACRDCDDRPACSWRKFGEPGCGDLEYIARKMHLDRRDGGAIISLDERL